MPQLADGSPSATLVRWIVAPGASISSGGVFAVIEGESARAELVCPSEATFHEALCVPGTSIPVGAPIALLLLAGESPGTQADDARRIEPTSGAPAHDDQSSVSAPENAPMTQPSGPVAAIVMPQAGNSMEEGTLLSWKVKVGDRIAKGDIVAEIETDKANMEVEAEEEGVVALLVASEGDIVPIKEPLAVLADSESDARAWLALNKGSAVAPVAPAPAAARAPAPAKPSAPKPATAPRRRPAPTPDRSAPARGANGRIKASPAARQAALKLSVSLEAVSSGSGPHGRILSSDVEAAARAGVGRATVSAESVVAPAGPVYVEDGTPIRMPVTKMRRAIARNLVASKQQVPHFYLKIKIDASPLVAYQKAEKAKYKVSLNDVLVLSVGRVLQEFPAFRTRMDGDELVEVPHSNIGIAVGTDDGLIVPVVIGVEGMSLEELAGETRRVVASGRAGKVEGQGHGVFTISNLGMFGVPEFSAIINPPESGILAVGTVVEEVIVTNGAMRPGRTMTLTLSADHRVVDGMVAGQFAARLKEVLENPRVLA